MLGLWDAATRPLNTQSGEAWTRVVGGGLGGEPSPWSVIMSVCVHACAEGIGKLCTFGGWGAGLQAEKRQCLCSASPCCWSREMNPVIGTRVRRLGEEWCLQAGQDFPGSPLNGEPSQHVPGLGAAGGKRVVLSSVDAGLCGLDCVQMCGHKRCGAQPQGVWRGQLRPLLVVGWWLARHGEGLDCQPASHPMCVVV